MNNNVTVNALSGTSALSFGPGLSLQIKKMVHKCC